jgi:hypothetical protein
LLSLRHRLTAEAQLLLINTQLMIPLSSLLPLIHSLFLGQTELLLRFMFVPSTLLVLERQQALQALHVLFQTKLEHQHHHLEIEDSLSAGPPQATVEAQLLVIESSIRQMVVPPGLAMQQQHQPAIHLPLQTELLM